MVSLRSQSKGIDYIGVGVGAMIFNTHGKVFLTKRGEMVRNEKGCWEFPGGAVHFGEKCVDAIIREVKEENDFLIEIHSLLEVVDHIIEEEKQHWVSPSYIAHYVSGEPKIMELDKCSALEWMPLDKIDSETLSLASLSNFNTYKEKFGLVPPTF